MDVDSLNNFSEFYLHFCVIEVEYAVINGLLSSFCFDIQLILNFINTMFIICKVNNFILLRLSVTLKTALTIIF